MDNYIIEVKIGYYDRSISTRFVAHKAKSGKVTLQAFSENIACARVFASIRGAKVSLASIRRKWNIVGYHIASKRKFEDLASRP